MRGDEFISKSVTLSKEKNKDKERKERKRKIRDRIKVREDVMLRQGQENEGRGDRVENKTKW